MRLDQRIQGFDTIRDRLAGFDTVLDRMPKVNTVLDEMSKVNTAFAQMPKVNTALGEQMSRINTTFAQMPKVNTVLDEMSRVSTAFAQMPKVNTVLDEMSRVSTAFAQLPKINIALGNQMSRVNTAFAQMSKVNTALGEQVSRINTAFAQMPKVNTVLDEMSRVNTAFGQLPRINTFEDRWLKQLNTLQNVEDRISKLTTFSHNLFPFVEKHVEDLLKEKAVSNQKMTDEVKKQVEDLCKELENEEIADGVESLERFWRKVVEVPNKMPDWLKGCLIMITWNIFDKYLLPHLPHLYAYLYAVLQIFHHAAGPTTIENKPMTEMIKKAERQGLHLPSEYQIVTARVLNVRERPTIHSDIRGKLLVGDLVVIKKKEKDWSLVEYSNEETRGKIQGWVSTCYLHKIN